MRRILALIALLCAIPASAQTGAVNGFCDLGGSNSKTSGNGSSNYMQGIIPQCTVTVYLTGTLTKATIYSDRFSTPLANPFTANAYNPSTKINAGKWLFFAAVNQGLDVVMSGGIPPNNYPQPVTITDIFPSSSFNPVINPFILEVNGTPISPPSPGNFVDTATVTWAFTGGQVKATAVGGSSGCAGTVMGDNTSTNCGFGNQAGNVGTYISTFGYTNVIGSNTHDMVTAVGTRNVNQDFGQQILAAGDSNFTDVLSTNHASAYGNIGLGWNNGVHDDSKAVSTDTNEVWIGSWNGTDVNGFAPTELIGIGAGTLGYWGNGSSEIIAMGDSSLTNSVASASTNEVNEAVGIGDQVFGYSSGTQPTSQVGDNWVGMGDAAGINIHPASVDVVAVGDGVMAQAPSLVTVTPVSDVLALGDYSAKYNQGNDIVAVGHGALSANASGAGVGCHNSGNEIVAIGEYPLVCNTTGTQNVAIGGYAGSIGYVHSPGTNVGNSNKTGSQNTWIGYRAGPNTTTQLSNTIALGYQAYNTASNQTTIGNPSTTSLKLYGCSAGQTVYDDGSGTCYTPGSGGSVPSANYYALSNGSSLINGKIDYNLSNADTLSLNANNDSSTAFHVNTANGNNYLWLDPVNGDLFYSNAGLSLQDVGSGSSNINIVEQRNNGGVNITANGSGGFLSLQADTRLSLSGAGSTVLDWGATNLNQWTFAAAPVITGLSGTSPLCANGTNNAITNVGCAGGSSAFSSLTSGTNTTAAMVVGNGASLAPTGTGTIQATNISGTVAASSPITLTGSGTVASPYTLACPTCGTSTATSVTINGGSALGTANFNGTTPAAGANGKNVTWQVSGSNVSAEIVGDGNAAHYLDGTGNYSTPGGGGGSGTVSGQASGVIPLGTSATVIGNQSHLDDGNTTAGVITSSEPITISGTTHGVTIAAGTAASGAAGSVVYASDATNGYAEVNENNTGLSRVCTAGNSQCAGVLYNTSGTVLTNSHFVIGSGTMTGGTLSVTLSGSAIYSSSSSYTCTANDGTAKNAIEVTYSSGSAFSVIGTSGDTATFMCIGN